MYDNPGEVRIASNFRCLHCKVVISTPQGINGHLHSRHKVPTDQITHTVDWSTTKAVACDIVSMPVRAR